MLTKMKRSPSVSIDKVSLPELIIFVNVANIVHPHSARQLHPSNIVTQELGPDYHKSRDNIGCYSSATLISLCQVPHLQLPLGLQLSQSALSHRPQLRLAAWLRPPPHLPG